MSGRYRGRGRRRGQGQRTGQPLQGGGGGGNDQPHDGRAPAPFASNAADRGGRENTPVYGTVVPSASAPPTRELENFRTVVPLQMDGPTHDQAVPLVPLSFKRYKALARPGFGSFGKKCLIKANHFLVDLGNKDPYQYDVTITPEVTSKTKCRDIMKCLTEEYQASHMENRQLAYDGRKSAFVAGPLPFDSKEFVITVPEKDGQQREFKVTVKFAAKTDLDHLRMFLNGRQHDNPQETIYALDVVLRESASRGREVVGRSIFSSSFDKGSLGNGIEYWRGFYQSLCPTQMGLSLNIDVSARAFYGTCLVSDFVMDYLGKDITTPLSDQERIRVEKALRRVRVEACGGSRGTYKVQSITTQTTSQLTFPIGDNGTPITVVQYFHEKYNLVLRFPFLPAIQAVTNAKPIYLPMEVCRLVDSQRYYKKLNERQVTAMLRATCRRPRERETEIDTVLKENKYNQDKLVNGDFGMRVREQLTSIEARVLPPPLLKYHESGCQSEVNPSVGQWNMINLKMVNGGTVKFWTIINFSRHRQDAVDRFCNGIISMCQEKGMEFNPRPVSPIQSATPQNIENTLANLHGQCSAQIARVAPGESLQLLFVILPEMSGSYGKIKKICETELGIVSQCCQPKHIMKPNRQYFENVALKINVKVGGTNTVLSRQQPLLYDRPTIIFGADVNHPQPSESGPSIAAVVASMDWPHATKYRALVSAQSHRQEIIEDLYTTYNDPKKGIVHKGMIRDHIMAFYKSTGRKPERIIFYRGGVSVGQLNAALLYEMDKIRKACISIEENYLPRVTFIVVQKRHHTRLFPMNHGDQASAYRACTYRSGNVLPGTVVDIKICHPTGFDFYLCSHAGIQGTSRPAHYHVLYDENNFTADGLQVLTNNLCYTYARCTRSVSVVPPAYYAHLTAVRARYYTEDMMSDSESGGRGTRERTNDMVGSWLHDGLNLSILVVESWSDYYGGLLGLKLGWEDCVILTGIVSAQCAVVNGFSRGDGGQG